MQNLSSKKIKPFVKWVGSKQKLLQQITPYIPKEYNHYFEPFVGCGALFFYLQPNNATINDLNLELINAYKVIKDNPYLLIEHIKQHKNKQDYFYKIRNLDRTSEYNSLSLVEKTSRFIYLNKSCYNGLYRVNKKNQFNSPFGRYSNPTYIKEENILNISKYLNETDIRILNQDFSSILKQCRENDFVYLDPPYIPLNKTSNFTEYCLDGFNQQDHITLKKYVDVLTIKKCKVLLSNSFCDFVLELYSDSIYSIETVYRSGNINSDKNKRGKVKEVLIKNYVS